MEDAGRSSPEAAPARPATPEELKLGPDDRRYDPETDGKITAGLNKATKGQRYYIYDRLRTGGPEHSTRKIGQAVDRSNTAIWMFAKNHGAGPVSTHDRLSVAEQEEVAMRYLAAKKSLQEVADLPINGKNVTSRTVLNYANALQDKYKGNEEGLKNKLAEFKKRNPEP
jgi:hypothetical protein